MFASWRVGVVQTDSGAGRVFDAAEMIAAGKRSSSHLACNTCRARKLRCSGAERGCLRCRSTQTVCTYPGPTSTPARQRKKSKTSTSSHNDRTVATKDARKSPSEGTITGGSSQEPKDQVGDDEHWHDENGQIPDWAFDADTDYTWSGLVVDSAAAFGELHDTVVELASPSSSTGLALQSELLLLEDQQTQSLDAAPRTSENGYDMINCDCLSRSASVLDQLTAPGIAPSPATTDQLIASYRSASQVLHELQDCSMCSSRSEIMTIVVMALQRILALCEWMVERQVNGTGSEDCELRFGRVLVTTIAERNSLSHALILAQCQNLATLFEKVKIRAAWMPGPLALLGGMEPRVSAMVSRLI